MCLEIKCVSADKPHFENLDLKCSKINGPPNFSLFDTFLDVEQEFIPKKFQKLCPFKGRANQGLPIQPIWAEGLNWPALVSPALKRTQFLELFGYK